MKSLNDLLCPYKEVCKEAENEMDCIEHQIGDYLSCMYLGLYIELKDDVIPNDDKQESLSDIFDENGFFTTATLQKIREEYLKQNETGI